MKLRIVQSTTITDELIQRKTFKLSLLSIISDSFIQELGMSQIDEIVR